ncbi:RNA-binding protein CP29B- chloroplastic [Striga hermonthica]|uniref:RNA-binding protein CP29B- chloroplastic n=1 Tax=Striga hermonthica TaxID=68872 RepID=A0A9N7NUS0_STRHE|nr:RNA-binding protein CP29B- chloroplastic [Striga hermonthica]
MAASALSLTLTPKTLSIRRFYPSSAALLTQCSLKPLPKLVLALSPTKGHSNLNFTFVPKVSLTSQLMEEGEEDEAFDLSGLGPDEPSFPPEQKLYVGNVPFSVGSDTLAGLFQQVGSVEMVEVIFDKNSGRSRGFGFVTMSSIKEAEAAVQQLNGYELECRALKVNSGPPPKRENSPPRAFGSRGSAHSNDLNTLFVTNLSWGIDNITLENFFSKQGRVKNARVICDRESGRSKGFGFVTYHSPEEVNRAIAALDGADLNGRSIRVMIAEARSVRMRYDIRDGMVQDQSKP